jgi:membrane protease YdiL (CAAX protease family)
MSFSPDSSANCATNIRRSVLLCAASIFIGWTLYVWQLYELAQSAPQPWRSVWDGTARVFVFVLPVGLCLHRFQNEKPLSFLKLNRNIGAGLAWGLGAGAAQIALNIARLYWHDGVSPGVTLAKLLPVVLTSLIVAVLVEEIAFRGFLLQSLARVGPFWAANVVSSLLFVAIHWPGWLLASEVPFFRRVCSQCSKSSPLAWSTAGCCVAADRYGRPLCCAASITLFHWLCLRPDKRRQGCCFKFANRQLATGICW